MPILFASKFDEDPIETERVSLERPFSHYKSMGIFLDAQWHLTPKGPVRSGRNSNVRDLLPVLVTCKSDEDRIKTERFSVATSLSANFSSLKGK